MNIFTLSLMKNKKATKHGFRLILKSVLLLFVFHAGISSTAVAQTPIYTWNDLTNMRSSAATSFILMNDLTPATAGYETTAGGWVSTTSTAGWDPIVGFSKTFDGNNYTISGLWCYMAPNYAGTLALFNSLTAGAVVKNLKISLGNSSGRPGMEGGSISAALVGTNTGGIISNITVLGGKIIVPGPYESHIGGVVAKMSGGSLTDITNNAIIEGGSYSVSGAGIGGILGEHTGGTLSGTLMNNAAISGYTNVGGIIGYKSGGTISCNMTNTGKISSNSLSSTSLPDFNVAGTGGIIGNLFAGGTITHGYQWINNGAVVGSFNTGGIAGLITANQTGLVLDGSGTISASWLSISNTGTVSSATNTNNDRCLGGIAGYFHPGANIMIQNCTNTVAITGPENIGGVVGFHDNNGTLQNCFNSGPITGSRSIGGIVGEIGSGAHLSGEFRNSGAVGTSATINIWNFGGIVGKLSISDVIILDGLTSGTNQVKVSNTGTISGGSDVGGLVGWMNSATVTIQQYVNTAEIKGTLYVGGIVGLLGAGGKIVRSYNKGAVTGTESSVGGIAGTLSGAQSSISDCYNLGTVTAPTEAGGVIGSLYSATISNCYNAGKVSGGGGFVGLHKSGSYVNCYFDQTTSGQLHAATIYGNLIGVTGLPTTLLAGQLPTGFGANWASGLSGKKTYPYLAWQTTIGKNNAIGYTSILPTTDELAALPNVNVTIVNDATPKWVFNPFGTNFAVLPAGSQTVTTTVPAGTPVSVGVMSESDVVAFDVSATYTVVYHLASASGTGIGTPPVDPSLYIGNDAIFLASGHTGITPPDCAVFAGWTINSDNTGTVYDEYTTYPISASDPNVIHFYPKWTDFKAHNYSDQVIACLPSVTIDLLPAVELNSACATCGTATFSLPFTTVSAAGANVSVVSNKIKYDFPANFTGVDSIQYRVTACGGQTDDAWLHIIVAPCPDNINTADCVGARTAFDWEIKEAFVSAETNVATYITPLVADLDGDGIPEILAAKFDRDNSGNDRIYKGIYVYWGTDREHPTLIPTVEGFFATFGFSVARVNIGGVLQPIVVMMDQSGYLYAYTPDPTKTTETAARLWKSNVVLRGAYKATSYSISFADFNNDGETEVYAGNQIFNAATGILLAEGPVNGNRGESVNSISDSYASFAADVDGDGRLELLVGTEVYSVNIVDKNDYTKNSLTLLASIPAVEVEGETLKDGLTVAADINQDGRLDVVIVGSSSGQNFPIVAAWDVKTQSLIGKGRGASNRKPSSVGLPFVGNVDTEPSLEILFVSGNNGNGADNISSISGCRLGANQTFDLKYIVPTTDRSGTTGITLFDFNNTGQQELVYRDETDLRIMHANEAGATFDNLATFPCGSGTGFEYPVIADVDNSGSASIVTVGGAITIPSHTSYGQLKIYKSGNQYNWASARKVWNQALYNVANVNEDATIPQYQTYTPVTLPNGKQVYNAFLQQQTLLNINGDPLMILPNIVWVGEPTMNYYDEGDSIVYTGTIKNIGAAALSDPFYITTYKNSATVANIIQLDEVQSILLYNETITFKVTIRNISQYGEISSIIISVNDKSGVYPYQQQCFVAGRKEVSLSSFKANPDTLFVDACLTNTLIDVLANDSLTSCTQATVTLEIVTPPTHGSATVSNQQIAYTLEPGFVGLDSISYRITCAGSTSMAQVYLTITANDESAFADDVWYFGQSTDANTGSPGIIFKKDDLGNYYPTDASGISKVNTPENSLVVSSPYCDGQLIYYMQHNELYNNQNEVMSNGNISGDASCADGLASCYMGDNKYLVFSVTGTYEESSRGLNAYIVDMNGDYGKGARTTSFIIEADNTNMSESIELIPRLGSSTQYWLVYGYKTEMRCRLVDVTLGTPVETNYTPITKTNIHTYALVANSQKNKIAILGKDSNTIDFFDFNHATGVLSNFQSFTTGMTEYLYGAIFTPNGKYLYITSYDIAAGNAPLAQYDVSGANPVLVGTRVQYWEQSTGTYKGGGLKLGPDGKIYVAQAYSNYVGTISDPDLATPLSGRYNIHGFQLSKPTGSYLEFSTGITKPDVQECNTNQPPVGETQSVDFCINDGPSMGVPLTSGISDPDGDTVYLTNITFATITDSAFLELSFDAQYRDVTITCKPGVTIPFGKTFDLIYSIKDDGIPASMCNTGLLQVTNVTPATPTASNNGPLCVGNTLNLSASTVAGATYLWEGPIGFMSTLQNPSISNATTEMSGEYSLGVALNGCGSAASTEVIVTECVEANDDYAQALSCDPSTITVDVLANDNLGSCLRTDARFVLSVVTPPKHAASLTQDVNKNLVYQPVPGYVGLDSLEYNILCEDEIGPIGSSGTATAWLYITVLACPVPAIVNDCSTAPYLMLTPDYNGSTYQWQISTNGDPWGDIPGATDLRLMITQTASYRAKVTFANIETVTSAINIEVQMRFIQGGQKWYQVTVLP